MRTIKQFVRIYIVSLVAGPLLAFLLSRCIVNAYIPSGSMMNQIQIGDRLIGNKLAYKLTQPERFDIVIFKSNFESSKLLIKRVIGLPNETVTIRDSKIYIDHNEEPLYEDYLPEEWIECNTNMKFEVPEDCYFVLGDDRNCSEDSRYWSDIASNLGYVNPGDYSYIRRDSIVAKAVLKIYPTIKVLE